MRLDSRLGWLRDGLLGLVAALAILVLIGWMSGSPQWSSLMPNAVPMFPNTALSLLLLAMANLGYRLRESWQGRASIIKAISVSLGLAVMLIGGFTLASYLLWPAVQIDGLLFDVPPRGPGDFYPGRMPPSTAIALLFGAVATIVSAMSHDRPRIIMLAHACAGVCGVIGLLALIGYSYDSRSLYQTSAYQTMALPTALALFLFAAAILIYRPFDGWLEQFRKQPWSLKIFVQLMGVALVLPFLIGMGMSLALHWGWIPQSLILSIAALLTMLGMLILVWMVVTGMRRDEVGVRATLEQLRLAENIAAVGYWQRNLATGRYSWAPSYYQLFGVDPSASALSPDLFLNLVHPEDRQKAAHADLGFDATFKANDREFRIRRADTGEERWLLSRFSVVKGIYGQPQRIFGIICDITARKQASLNLEQSQLQLNLALQAAQIGIHDYDIPADTIYLDARAREIWDIPADLPIDIEFFYNSLHEDDRAATQMHVDAALDPAGNGKYYSEYRVLGAADKCLRWVAATGQVTFHDGKAVRLTGTVRDITAQLDAESAVRNSLRRYTALVNAIGDTVWTMAGASGFVSHQTSWGRYTGQTWEEMRGSGWLNAIHVEDRPMVVQSWHEALANETLFHASGRLWHQPSSTWRHFLLRAAPVPATVGSAPEWIGVSEDIEAEFQTAVSLRSVDRRLLNLLQVSPLAIIEYDARSTAIFHNRTARLLFEIDEFEAVLPTIDWRQLPAPDLALDPALSPENILLSGVAINGDRYRLKVGARAATTIVQVYGVPIYNDLGTLAGCLMKLADITSQQETQQQLTINRARLNALFESLPLGIAIADAKSGEVIDWNKRAEEMFGPALISRIITQEGSAYDREGNIVPAEDYPLHQLLQADKRKIDMEILTMLADGRKRWLRLLGARICDDDDNLIGAAVAALDIDENVRSVERQKMLVDELNHRVKNTLAVVRSLASQSLQGSDIGPARTAFEARLQALSMAHDILSELNWHDISLHQLIGVITRPVDPEHRRIKAEGPPFVMMPRLAITMALALHELTTNALKYGALSDAHGRVAITWTLAPAGHGQDLHLRWQETGGPAVSAPSQTGFGTRMLQQALALELDGNVKLHFEPAGLTCEIAALLPHRQTAHH